MGKPARIGWNYGLIWTLVPNGLQFQAMNDHSSGPNGGDTGIDDELTIQAAHRAFACRELSAGELTQHYLDRVAALNPMLNSIVTLNPNAVEEARALDGVFAKTGRFVGPLHGVPVVVKDLFETAEIPTAFGSTALRDYIPTRDATIIVKLQDAGAIILGKTTMPDFAASFHGHSSRSGVTHNPYDLTRDPGGSSSGTASAVAANLALVGVGTDTGGSIRVPASFCGLVGLRPTPGLISRAGAGPLISEQDTPGPMTRTVADAAVMLDAMAGWDPTDPLTAIPAGQRRGLRYVDELVPGGLHGARIGVLRTAWGTVEDAERQVAAVVETALAGLRTGGAELIDPVEIPGLIDDLIHTFFYFAQSRRDINEFLASRDMGFDDVADIVSSGHMWPTLVLLHAIAAGPVDPHQDPLYGANRIRREALTHKIAGVFAQHQLDAMVFPDVRIPAPIRADIDAGRWEEAPEGVDHPQRGPFPVNTLIASQAWLPAITVPAGFTESGLPVGLEFLGLPWHEAKLLRLSHDFEALTRHRRPPAMTKS